MRNPRDGEGGFSLVEVMVVLMIIAVLLAVAIPTFLLHRASAHDRRAQADLRIGISAARLFLEETGYYIGFDSEAAEGLEPAIRWRPGPQVVVGEITIRVANETEVVLTSPTPRGDVFCLAHSSVDGIRLGRGNAGSYTGCNGSW